MPRSIGYEDVDPQVWVRNYMKNRDSAVKYSTPHVKLFNGGRFSSAVAKINRRLLVHSCFREVQPWVVISWSAAFYSRRSYLMVAYGCRALAVPPVLLNCCVACRRERAMIFAR